MLKNLSYNPVQHYLPRDMKERCIELDMQDYWKEWENVRLSDVSRQLSVGIYEFFDLNQDMLVETLCKNRIINQYPFRPPGLKEYFESPEKHMSPYGVCDHYTQIIHQYRHLLFDPAHSYVIVVCEITKKEQPETGGWRWRKWGPYIGNHHISYEYLYDEPEVESVYCYRIFEIE